MKKNSEAYKLNYSNVLEFIYRNKETSRIEIANDTGLTPATITHIVSEMIENNLLVETGDEVRGGKGSGRNRKLLKLNEEFAYFLGIEINMKGLFFMLTNLVGESLVTSSLLITEFSTRDINQVITDEIKKIIHSLSEKNIIGIGIAVPGHYDSEEKTIITNNKKWEYFNLKEIEKNISIPFKVENNIECMALSEYLFEASSSPDNFLFFHIGHGLFCSFFDAKRLEIKKNYYIGEIGHTVVNIEGPVCECGKKGCLQTYISDSWLLKNARFLFDHSNNTTLKSLVTNPDEIQLSTIIDGYILGDSFLTNQIDLGLIFLGTSVANTLILHDAKKIYINSELLNVPQFQQTFITFIRDQLSFIPTKTDLEIEIIPYHFYRGARGAAALAALSFFIKHPNFSIEN